MKIIFPLLFLIPSIVFADLKILDNSGLTRAEKRDIKEARVVLEVLNDQGEVVLSNLDGYTNEITGSISNKIVIFPRVPRGIWKVTEPKNLRIKSVKIEN